MTREQTLIPLLGSMAIFLFVLFGCSTMRLSKGERSSIDSVSINKYVEKPKTFTYKHKDPPTSADAGRAILNVVGGALDLSVTKKRVGRTWDRAYIDIQEIILEHLENHLSSSGLFTSILPSGADAEFTIEIVKYGFSESSAWDASRLRLKPMLDVKGRLAKRDGTILWAERAGIGLFVKTPSYYAEDFYENPALMRAAMSEAAEAVIDYLIKEMTR